MHLYLRLLNATQIECYSAEEKENLLAVLRAAPGVEQVKLIQQHHKGGYAVTMDVEKESLDQLIEYLPANGLQSVF